MRQLTRGVDTSDCVSEETEAATFHTPVGEEVSLRFSKMQLSISNAITTGATNEADHCLSFRCTRVHTRC